MPEIKTINVTHPTTALGVDTGILWWNKRYPFKVDVGIYVDHNPIPIGQIIEVSLPSEWVESGKVNSNLSDIQAVRGTTGSWELAPTQATMLDNRIFIEFQTVDEVEVADIYEIYYGNSDVSTMPQDEDFLGVPYIGLLDFSSKFTSMTNPTQDWINDDGAIESLRPEAKAFVDMNVKRLGIRGTKGPDCGIVRISRDGLDIETVDLYNGVEIVDINIFSYEMPEPGRLNLKIEVLREKNPSSSDYRARLEGVEYDTFARVEVGNEKIYPKLAWTTSTGAS